MCEWYWPTWGGIPNSRKRGPKMKPPPRPSNPPTIPATMPQEQYIKIWCNFQFVISFPLDAITLVPLYKHIASKSVTDTAIGTYIKMKVLCLTYYVLGKIWYFRFLKADYLRLRLMVLKLDWSFSRMNCFYLFIYRLTLARCCRVKVNVVYSCISKVLPLF